MQTLGGIDILFNAVVNLPRALAIDYGADDIRVNCVCPGDTDTAMLRFEAGLLGTPEAVLYLVSEASSFVAGATLVVDGGG